MPWAYTRFESTQYVVLMAAVMASKKATSTFGVGGLWSWSNEWPLWLFVPLGHAKMAPSDAPGCDSIANEVRYPAPFPPSPWKPTTSG